MEEVLELPVAPLFENANQALTFAFNHSGQQFAKSIMNVMMGAATRLGDGKGLGGLDGAAQAGMVKACLEELETAHGKNALMAKYSRQPGECAHCGGSTPRPEWHGAVAQLTMAVQDAVDAAVHARLRKVLVARYFGHKTELNDIAKKFSLHRVTVSKHNRAITTRLRRIENEAMKEIEALLQKRGILAKTA